MKCSGIDKRESALILFHCYTLYYYYFLFPRATEEFGHVDVYLAGYASDIPH